MLDADLQELKAMRQVLSDRIRLSANETSGEIREALAREVKHLQRSVRNAQRSAKAALRGWEKLAREYARSTGARLPAPA